MPIYEYDCPECGTVEVIQKVDDDPLKECPDCAKAGKSSAVAKKVSAAAFHLKGGGWYKTDYSSSSNSSSSDSSSSDSSGSDKKADTSSSSSSSSVDSKE